MEIKKPRGKPARYELENIFKIQGKVRIFRFYQTISLEAML